ncbi:MAG: flagellar FlbD family protein [Terriglobia bacterium]
MIHLTRLNKQPVVVNSDLIKFVEYTPDTVVTLVSGEKIVVTETTEQILDRIIEFRRRLIVCPNDPGPPKEVSEPTECKQDMEE